MTRRMFLFALALAVAFTMIPGFAIAESEPAAADLEPVTLDWYFGQTEMTDCSLVNEAVNEYLQEKLNTTVNLHYWGLAEDWEKMVTMISSGQDVGIIGFGSQTKLDYVVQSQRGAYYPIEDLLDTHAPETKALFSDEIWECMTINDHIYGIPSLKDNGYYISLVYNDTLAQELGINMDEVQYRNWRDLEELGLEVKEKRDAAHPEWADYPVFWTNNLVYPYNFAFETFLNDSYLAVCDIDEFDQIAGVDSSQVVNFYATDEFREYCIQRQRMVDEGLYAYDYTDRTDWQYTGAIFGWVGWGYTYMEEHMYGENFVTKMKMSENLWTETNNYFSAGTAISANCANPERAMMVLNLINTDPDFATMMRFGIEGTHYVVDEEGNMSFEGTRNEDPTNRSYYYWYMAPIGNLLITRAPEQLVGPDSIMLTNMQKYNEEAVLPAHFGFVFDTAPVINEIAACTNVIAEYQTDLANGQLNSADEVNQAVDEFVEKLNANGAEKIVAEVQSQIDAWQAAKAA